MSELDNSAIFDDFNLNWGMSRIRSQTAPEASCAYCASIITGSRCDSCGAPRREEKERKELYRAWKDLASC